MNRARKYETVRERIAGEHAAIDRLVTEIQTELDWLEKRRAKVGEPWDLPLTVASLRDHLERHFELEEDGGPLDRAQHKSIRVRAEVAELVGQHRGFSTRLARLLAEMDCGFLPPRTVQACFALELRQIISDLREHEGTELLLFDRVFRGRPDRRPLGPEQVGSGMRGMDASGAPARRSGTGAEAAAPLMEASPAREQQSP